MQQIALQFPTGQNLAQRRALWFVSILLTLLIASAIGGTYFHLRTARENIPANLAHDFGMPIQQKAIVLQGWYTRLHALVTRLAGMDMLRLFANEVGALNDNEIFTMLAHERKALTSPGDTDTVSRLASQIPIMRHSLQTLIAHSNIVSATLVTRSLHPYLSTEESMIDASAAMPSLLPNLQQAIQACLRDGKEVSMPFYATPDKRLYGVIIQPLFAPEYIAHSDKNIVGAIILTCNITHLVQDMTIDNKGDSQDWLFQKGESGLQRLLPDGTISAPFPGWETDASGNLAIALRTFPDGGDTYAMGVQPQEVKLPLLIVKTIPAESVETAYESHRSRVIFAVGACTLIAVLLIGIFWWWLVGRRERTMSSTLKQLYQTVNQQHELLNSINTSLADGIILNDKHGVIGYVNKAFAAMVDIKPENLIGRAVTATLGKQFSDLIFQHMEQTIKSNKYELHNEVLMLKGDQRNYHVSCSPFHDAQGNTNGVVSVYSDTTDLLRAQAQAQIVLNQTISALVRAIEAIDPYLGGQSMQTGTLALHLAQSLNLEETHAKTLRLAANLSQLGMIQVPRHLVNKAGSLTEQEREELQKHVEYTRATLEGISFGLPVMDAIYEMHERLDGSGYPRHLRGDEIGINGRILSVANTFCALVCPRSYRQAHAMEYALEILSDTPPKYDPKIVSILREFLQTQNGADFLHSLTTREDK